MSISWEEVVAFAVTLPEVAESTSYRTPSLKVAGTLLGRLRTESEGGLALKCSADDKEALLASADPAFYTTSHYDGHNYILVNLDVVDTDGSSSRSPMPGASQPRPGC
ncbi:MmcQ/YjbR family DNA-binding protein [Aeromicrobium sp. UC242_57]|uniref:MmcQ/YjbR family DNA-binding protein n=1 Tax=Aeromicrobium sp. UC242_57 TaxID=3374624 RepID=UPI00378E6D00